MIAIVKRESDDTTIEFTLFVWNGSMYVKKDKIFIYWCDVYGNNVEKIAVENMIDKNSINDNWQML